MKLKTSIKGWLCMCAKLIRLMAHDILQCKTAEMEFVRMPGPDPVQKRTSLTLSLQIMTYVVLMNLNHYDDSIFKFLIKRPSI